MSLRIFYKVWMRFGLAISKITTPLILGLVFFVMITPLALIRRIFASDQMRRNLDKDSDSYRVESRVPTKEDLRRPF